MQRIAIAALVGVLAALLLAGVYFGAPYAHIPITPAAMVVVFAILAFAGSLSAFTLVALNRTPAAAMPSEISPLNKEPVKPFIAMFREHDPIPLLARPDMSVSEITVRTGDMFKDPESHSNKKILLTIKAAKKGVFNPVVLRELFEKLKPFPFFYHVLLLGESDEFVGYIPRDTALKDFTGENAETKIRKCIVDVLADPAKSSALRAMKGAAQDDTISETADIRAAARKIWFDEGKNALRADDPVQGLVVCRNLKPVGFLDKAIIFTLMSTGA